MDTDSEQDAEGPLSQTASPATPQYKGAALDPDSPDSAGPTPQYKGALLDPDSPDSAGPTPQYKGAPLDAERGPGLGCFWLQVVVLGLFLVLTPLTVVWRWEPWISAALLFATLLLLLLVGQTTIFLLRLVAADRRATRRRPMSPIARKTVGDLEEESAPPTKSDQDDA